MMNGPKLPPLEMVIFGAAGDLTWRKLVPALFNLYQDDLLPEKFAIFGVDVKSNGLVELRRHLLDGVNQFSRRGKPKTDTWKIFANHLVSYVAGDFNNVATFEDLAKTMSAQDKSWGEHAERVFYLATPPTIVETIVHNLGLAHLVNDRKRARLVVENPSGMIWNQPASLT
jgi:glucose-6-phosphate 1-dehydrogenase